MIFSVFVLSATATTKVSHRATRSTADLFKEQLAELVADDERSPFFGPAVQKLVANTKMKVADALVMAMGNVTTADEWHSHFRQELESTSLLQEVSKMFQYGCWGHYQPDIPAHGATMDAYDRAAKEWHSCRACAEIDQDCPRYTPEDDLEYDYRFFLVGSPWTMFNAELSNQLEFTCKLPTYGGCQRMMCECDLRLVNELSKLYMSGDVELNNAYVSENGFDHDTHCVAQFASLTQLTAPGRGGVRQCCGQYPNRAFFNTDSQSCCDNTVIAGHNMC